MLKHDAKHTFPHIYTLPVVRLCLPVTMEIVLANSSYISTCGARYNIRLDLESIYRDVLPNYIEPVYYLDYSQRHLQIGQI